MGASSDALADRSKDLKDLVNSEREFAQRAKAEGMQQAFLSTLSDNAVVFRPMPVNGKLWYRERGESKALLIWEPEFADVSESGDLGYTTGPWEFLPNGERSEQTFFGHYLSIWRKTREGGWMVVVDIGVNHDAPYEPAELVTATTAGNRFDSDTGWNEVADLESAFDSLGGTDLQDHYAALLADDVRFYRDGAKPLIGKAAVADQLKSLPAEMEVSPMEIVVAASGDLGYAYGTQKVKDDSATASAKEAYLRIWRKGGDGKWQLAVNITLPAK